MAEPNKPNNQQPASQRIGQEPVPTVKGPSPENAFDPSATVADPASPSRTNPGPGARGQEDRDRPALPTMRTSTGAGAAARNMPNQPVVPAPSEELFPGIAGRPDPSRTREEAEGVADHKIKAHNRVPGHMMTGENVGTGEPTSDGKPDESVPPPPIEE